MTLHNLSHFLQIWAFPPGLILLLFLIGFILIALNRHLGKSIIIFSFITFWLLSTPIITQHLIDGLQKQYSPLALNTLNINPQQSAMIILGSGVENALEYANKHALSDSSLSRLQYAVYLYNKTHLPIITSGGNRDRTASTEAGLMKEALTNLYHVPVIMTESNSHTTRDEAALLAPLVKSQGIKTVYIITHAWHMPRSMLTFQHFFTPLGITVIPAPMGYSLLQSGGEAFSNYLPLLRALNISVAALHEYVGILWYRLFYQM